MAKLRLVGDVHGRYDEYKTAIKNADYSFQVGDLGFNYSPLDDLDFMRHKAIQGNHDNYGVERHKIFLGDYGIHCFEHTELFYVRGACSIDWSRRISGYSWWPEEELNMEEGNNALALYMDVKPKIMVTHEAPYNCVNVITDPRFAKWYGYDGVVETKTNQLLQAMLEAHQPDVWFFGHYHTSRVFTLPGYKTTFRCLDMIRNEPSEFFYDLDL